MVSAHEDLMKYARYPFLGGAGDCAISLGVEFKGLVSDRAFGSTRSRGVERALAAVRGGRIPLPVLESDVTTLEELLSYPLARMVISCTGDRYVIRRYALSEAERARALLLEELEAKDGGGGERVIEVAGELGLEAFASGECFSLHFTDFLKNTVQFKSKDWKLINQDWAEPGWILLSPEKFTRVLQHVIQRVIENSLPVPVGDDVKAAFGDVARGLSEEAAAKRKEFEASDLGRVSVIYLPPCMKMLLARLQGGENLSHSGRFALTAFLHCIGMKEEDIIQAFSLSPDFRDKIARYQIEHISGKGSGTEYTPPSCSTMKTYGICPGEDDICSREWMDHPLKYYRHMQRRKQNRVSRGDKKAEDPKKKAEENPKTKKEENPKTKETEGQEKKAEENPKTKEKKNEGGGVYGS